MESPVKRSIAVIIPCYNEALTIAGVVHAFRAQLPEAAIYVFDNRSTDRTAEEARRAGAIVRSEPRQGKGYVIQSMFRQVEADHYVMVDGDGTYPPEQVRALLGPVLAGEADMVVGSRLLAGPESEFKALNHFGNRLFRKLLNTLFGVQLTDLLSGYRAMNRRLVKCLPFASRGFESEAELTVRCLELGYRIQEVPAPLSNRPEGSVSKLRVVRDGALILRTVLGLARDYKPLTVFGLAGLLLMGCGVVPGLGVIREYLETGLVPRLPTAVLAVGLVLSGLLVAFAGLVLHTISRRFQELNRQLQMLLAVHADRGSDG